jgi:hypothetical protein
MAAMAQLPLHVLLPHVLLLLLLLHLHFICSWPAVATGRMLRVHQHVVVYDKNAGCKQAQPQGH